MASILVVDDESIICDFLATLLGNNGHEVQGAQEGEQALSMLKANPFDVVITDHRMEPMDGMELLNQIRQFFPRIPVIMISGYGKPASVIEALKSGAFDFLNKPIGMELMQATVDRALKYKQMMAGHVLDDEGTIPITYCLDLIIAESPGMKEICQKVQQVASVTTPVLINGPSGTGKSIVAEAIHRIGVRSDQPFHTVNCAEIEDEKLEMKLFGASGEDHPQGIVFASEGGTLYLKNIESTSTEVQAKVFQLLDQKRATPLGETRVVDVDVRIIASSNGSLLKRVGLHRFRPELYARLARVSMTIKPLADRPEDILPLFIHILQQATEDPTKTFTLDEESRMILQHHTWPGNIKEMESLAEQVLQKTQSGQITKEHLPELMVSSVEGSSEYDPEAAMKAAEAMRGAEAKAFLTKTREEYERMLKRKEAQASPSSDPEDR